MNLTILTIAYLSYVLISAMFMVLENRSPQTTFSWLLLFMLAPGLGLVIYYFFGRGYRAFNKHKELMQEKIGSDLLEDLGFLLERQKTLIERIAKEKPASYKKKLLNLGRNNASSILTTHNQVEILQNASEKYPRLLEDIRNAKHHIHMNYYIWTEDDFTEIVKDALIERAQAGVKVRCLYDAYGGSMSNAYLQELRDGGVEIHTYLEYRSLTRVHTFNYRSHRKIAVFDGHIGYIGGLNLDKDQIDGGKYFDSWRDTHLRIDGEATLALQANFAVSWFNTTDERISDPAYFPEITFKNFTPVQITMSGPDSRWRAIQQLYFYMIMAAEEKIYLQSPFFIPDASILEALKAAALAGVDVKMMFTPRGTSYTVPYWAANTYFEEVSKAGVKIYLYQAGYFHSKTLNIDNTVCTIGTANMDIRSFTLNYEANAVIYDEAIAHELEQDFLDDLEHCTEWSLAEYKKRKVYLRLRDSVSRLASPLL